MQLEITKIERSVSSPLSGVFERLDGEGANPHVDILEMNAGDLAGLLRDYKDS